MYYRDLIILLNAELAHWYQRHAHEGYGGFRQFQNGYDSHVCLRYGARSSGNSPFFDFDSFISRFLGEGLARTAVGNQATFLRFAALAFELGSGGSLAGGQVQ